MSRVSEDVSFVIRFADSVISREIHNFVGLYHDPTMATATREDYLAKVDKNSVLETFGAEVFSPKLRAVIGFVDPYMLWEIMKLTVE